jgi:release factor glutamine methyltransferase
MTEATRLLGSAHDAARIVEEASGWSGASLVLGLDLRVPDRSASYLARMVERRAAGEPLQYVLGRWAFRSLDLMVDRRVLIPRPETEQVVEVALAEARRLRERRGTRPLTVADLGTGSGAIALSLAAELQGAHVWGTDASADALDVAGANLAGLSGFAATRVRLVEGRWFQALPADLRGELDLVVSNPPYIGAEEALDRVVDEWEPAMALRAGPTGLECLIEIVSDAPQWLAADGVLIVELAPSQARALCDMAVGVGFAMVEVARDLAGRDRMLVARR